MMKDQKKQQDHVPKDKDPTRDIRKDHDPYRKDPGAGKVNDERVREADEREARQREGVRMQPGERLDDSTTAPVIDTGQAGQTTRGSYGFNSSTGQGEYMDRTIDGTSDASAEPLGHHRDAQDDLGDPHDPEEEDLHP